MIGKYKVRGACLLPMKTSGTTLVAGCLVFFILTSCNDFLSHPPDNRTSIDTAEKISELLVSAYPKANYIPFCEVMTDNVSAHPGAFFNDPTNTDPFFWRDATRTEQDSPEFYWRACYDAIAAANHALEAIQNASDPSAFDAQKGEALIARAYAHFMLVNLFAKTYNRATSSTDPGIPYVTEPEKVALKTYERHTVQYVYDKIEQDLTEGLPLIKDEVYKVPAYHFTRSASHAFAVRYYLFKKDYAKVIAHANLVFSDNDFASRLRPWNSTYNELSFDELAALYTRSTEKANLLLAETSSLWARSYYVARYSTGPDEWSDIRDIETICGGQFAYTVYGLSGGVETRFVVKFREHFVKESVSANIGLPYTIVPLFTAEEVLLSRAEALAYTFNFSAAVNDLNTFLSKRINNYDPASNSLTTSRINSFWGTSTGQTQAAVILTTLYLRRAEFLHEGLWWFDILRWDTSNFNPYTVVHIDENGELLELRQDDKRRVLQLPREAISIGGLEPNPR